MIQWLLESGTFTAAFVAAGVGCVVEMLSCHYKLIARAAQSCMMRWAERPICPLTRSLCLS